MGLDGKALVFPGGRPICLACGAEPAGTRRVWFEAVEGGVPLTRVGSLGRGVSALANRVTFDAPLCAGHLRRARALSLKAVGLALLGLAVRVGAIAGQKAAGWNLVDRKGLVGYLPFVPALIPWGFAYFYWPAKDRGGLACEMGRDGDGLVLRCPPAA